MADYEPGTRVIYVPRTTLRPSGLGPHPQHRRRGTVRARPPAHQPNDGEQYVFVAWDDDGSYEKLGAPPPVPYPSERIAAVSLVDLLAELA